MGKMKEDTRHRIICLRVSHEDYRFLNRISRKENVCVSDLMREALRNVMDACVEELELADCAAPDLMEQVGASPL